MHAHPSGEMSRLHAQCRAYTSAMDSYAEERTRLKRAEEWEKAEVERRGRDGRGEDGMTTKERMEALKKRAEEYEKLVREKKRKEREELKKGADDARGMCTVCTV